ARPVLAALALALAPAVLSAQQVHVVAPAPGPGVDFTDLQAAVDAAAPGDVVLVQGGAGWSATIEGKGLTLTGDVGPMPQIDALAIRFVPAGQRAVVRGCSSLQSPVAVFDNPGVVWFDHCVLRDTGVSESDAVVLTHCQLIGSPGQVGAAQPGLFVSRSTVHVFDSFVAAGDNLVEWGSGPGGGTLGNSYWFVPGEAGLRAFESDLFLSGSVVEGGKGGWKYSGGLLPSCTGLDGGAGVLLTGGSTLGRLDTPVQGGAAGCVGDGVAPPFVLEGGSVVTELPGAARSFHIVSPVREGKTTLATVNAEPRDIAVLALSPAASPLYLGGLFGSLCVGLPAGTQFVGVVPDNGELTKLLPVPELGPGVDAHVTYVQLGVLTVTGEIRVGAASALVKLDASL
ncbi:MAG TPA: hypothetical protein VJP77_08870, partial [Planctomycetota bacterium]|nr:hypothetical protein [Planctomycetota bacterium]